MHMRSILSIIYSLNDQSYVLQGLDAISSFYNYMWEEPIHGDKAWDVT